MSSLLPRHRKDLEDSGLSAETQMRSGIYSAPAEATRKLGFGHVGPGMVIPYTGQSAFVRLKPDRPPSGNGRVAKYLTPPGAGNRLYVPPTLDPTILQDPAERLLITEGEKKALKAVQEGFACVALAGVWNFQPKRSPGARRVLLPDFKTIAWEGRPVYLVYDSDLADNDNVRRAERALAQLLAKRNADVKLVRLPRQVSP